MNNKYRIELAKVEHFHAVCPRDYDSKVLFSSYGNSDQFLKMYVDQYAFTGFHGDDIIVIAGLYPLGQGKAEAWMFTSVNLVKHVKFILKSLKQHLNLLENTLELKRIQALCVDGFEEAHRFIQHLGFECETPNGMKNFGQNGETYKMYARTINDQA